MAILYANRAARGQFGEGPTYDRSLLFHHGIRGKDGSLMNHKGYHTGGAYTTSARRVQQGAVQLRNSVVFSAKTKSRYRESNSLSAVNTDLHLAEHRSVADTGSILDPLELL